MLNRRQFLITGTLAVPAALTVGTAPALAAPTSAVPEGDYWLKRIRARRDTIGIAATDGSDGTIRHRAHQPQPLCSTVKIVHLTAYATAVAEGRLDPKEPIRLADWDARHPYVSDGGAHRNALKALEIPCAEWGIADDPDRTVPLDALAASMIDFSDNAATDYLRHRLGNARLRRAGAAGGWHRPDVRSLQGEVLMLIMPEHQPPRTAPKALRVRIGDQLAARFIRDKGYRQEVFDRIPEMPSSTEEQWPWTQGTGSGTAAELAGMHHRVATGDLRPASALPNIRRHLERNLTSVTPDDAYGVGFKGGSLPKTLNLGLNVRWRDGRSGSLALMMTGLSEEELTHSAGALRLGVEALTVPERFAQLKESVTG